MGSTDPQGLTLRTHSLTSSGHRADRHGHHPQKRWTAGASTVGGIPGSFRIASLSFLPNAHDAPMRAWNMGQVSARDLARGSARTIGRDGATGRSRLAAGAMRAVVKERRQCSGSFPEVRKRNVLGPRPNCAPTSKIPQFRVDHHNPTTTTTHHPPPNNSPESRPVRSGLNPTYWLEIRALPNIGHA